LDGYLMSVAQFALLIVNDQECNILTPLLT